MGTFLPGDTIEGKYRVLKLLGEGGMNRVYLVEDIRAGTKWALKVSRDPGEIESSQQEIYNQFLKEVSILTTLKHKNLPVISDYFSNGTQHFLVEEYIEGNSLADRLKSTKPSQKDVLEWAIAICDAIEVLHKNNIIFRDLKPENVMLSNKGEIKLIDFDIARYYKPGRAVDTMLLGTPGYAAPETYGKAQSDVRSDIYSLGATLHHVITGVDPKDNPFHFEPVSKFRRKIDIEFEKIIMKAVQHKPEDRFSTISDMKKALVKVQAQSYPQVSPSMPLASAAGGQSKSSLSGKWVSSIIITVAFVMLIVRSCVQSISNIDSSQSPSPPARPTVTEKLSSNVNRKIDKEFSRYSSPAEGLLLGSVHVVPIVAKSPNSDLGVLIKDVICQPFGNIADPYPPTYLFSPSKMTDIQMDINPLIVRPGSKMEVTFRFITHYHTVYSKEPWYHNISVFFAMPESEKYIRQWGYFSEIPGEILSFKIRTLNRVYGDSSGVKIAVAHDDSEVVGKLEWKPKEDLPPLKYDSSNPWKGPRVVLNMNERWYSWQYTKGFVIGARQHKNVASR